MPPPRATYYIMRPGAIGALPSGGLTQGAARLVPLIAVDQLPEWIEIVGVPRQLLPEDAVHMLALAGGSGHGAWDSASDSTFEVRLVGKTAEAAEADALAETEAAEVHGAVEQGVRRRVATVETADAKVLAEVRPASLVGFHTPATYPTTPVPPGVRPGGPYGPESADEPKSPAEAEADNSGSFDTFCRLLARLSRTPMSQHFLNEDIDAMTAVHRGGDCGVGEGTADSDDLLQFEAAADEEDSGRKPVMMVTTAAATATSNSPAAAPQTAPVIAKQPQPQLQRQKKPLSGKPLSDKPAVIKGAWPAQKKREPLSPVKPCKYWCRFGTCAYGDKCRFTHTMPLTPAGLRAVDLDGLPSWWTAEGGGAGASASSAAPVPARNPDSHPRQASTPRGGRSQTQGQRRSRSSSRLRPRTAATSPAPLPTRSRHPTQAQAQGQTHDRRPSQNPPHVLARQRQSQHGKDRATSPGGRSGTTGAASPGAAPAPYSASKAFHDVDGEVSLLDL